jgi:hypothetical protein
MVGPPPLLEGAIRKNDEEGDRSVLVDLSPYYGHLDCFRELRPLLVMTNRFTYAPSYVPHGEMQNTWLSIALEGISALSSGGPARDPWKDVAVIGTGNGLDAIGISRIARPERIVASDIHPKVLPVARWNIDRYVAEGSRVTVRESDLFTGYPAGEAFDLIYENLPNVPDAGGLFEGIRSASCYAPRSGRDGQVWDRALLTLHHDFLVQARSRLREHGRVVCLIGGRIPVQLIHQMFRATGYGSRVIGFGLKIQSEADVVLPAYAAAERETGSSFTYYHPLEECIAITRGMTQPAELPARDDYARRLRERLHSCRISATEAVRLDHAGQSVCHSVYVVSGSLLGEPHGKG